MSPKFTALYDYEIDAYLQSVKGFRGCHSKDWFKGKNPKATEYVVINLDDSGGPGTHWTCLANRRDEDFIVYFDSFGIDPPQEILEYMRRSGKRMISTTNEIQNLNSKRCGWYCINFLLRRAQGEDPYSIVYAFVQKTLKNDKILAEKLGELGISANS